jgi:hypothetical protein
VGARFILEDGIGGIHRRGAEGAEKEVAEEYKIFCFLFSSALCASAVKVSGFKHTS